ncbi:hypothetical protein AVEN_127767-1 [Araneus ventricosus]|uniref:Uncharacterized protein n=1 Tax=Araneus ventricosus TaxID=182803 RepID=A0A4Y2SSV7_ARAVE|nr:hypothetical protein AVEN_127767-1 [Araneus ventricosus]
MPGEWSQPRPWRLLRRNAGSQKYWNFLDISIRSQDPDLSRCFHVTSRPVGEIIKGPYSDHRAVFGRLESIESSLDFERVDRLGSSLKSERHWNLSLELYPQCELVS